MKRVVTGHSKDGKSIFLSKGGLPDGIGLESLPVIEQIELWATGADPKIPCEPGEPPQLGKSFFPGLGETRFRFTVFPPAEVILNAIRAGVDPVAVHEEMVQKWPGMGESMEKDNPGMHTTDTVDYGIVISGEVSLELDDGEAVDLEPGDCVVQNGTRHAWRNHGPDPCVMAFVMFGVARASQGSQ